MKKTLTFLLIILSASSVFGQTNWFTGTFEEAKEEAGRQSKHILLNLTSTSS